MSIALRVDWEDGEPRAQALDVLLTREPNLVYRNFAPVEGEGGGAAALQRGLWTRKGHRVLVVREAGGDPVAALKVQEREFESSHFGMPVHAIDVPLACADDATRLSALRIAYAEALDALRAQAAAHVMTQVSTQDRAGCRAVQEQGCFHVGTRISWMAPLTGVRQPHQLPAGLRIERYEHDAIATLPQSSWERLLEYCGHAFDRGPFIFDMDVDAGLAASLYQIWTRKALSGEWSHVLLVVRDGEEVVAFNAMLLLPELSQAAGVGVLGRGIGASLPQYRGLFTALQKESAAVRPLGAGYLENEAQSATVGSINVFGRLGHPCLRSTASFHRSLSRR
ncbi:MAG TPA: hypothetical protein VEL28_18045 [Candidatus Binatia bacterium]|nr:hypothetical protein [Candidatus Binatia bacterium]